MTCSMTLPWLPQLMLFSPHVLRLTFKVTLECVLARWGPCVCVCVKNLFLRWLSSFVAPPPLLLSLPTCIHAGFHWSSHPNTIILSLGGELCHEVAPEEGHNSPHPMAKGVAETSDAGFSSILQWADEVFFRHSILQQLNAITTSASPRS